MSAFGSLLGSAGRGLLGFGKGLGTAAQYATTGSKYKDVAKAFKRPIRKGGLENPATMRNLMTLGFAGQGLGWITLPWLLHKFYEKDPNELYFETEVAEERAKLRQQRARQKLEQIQEGHRRREIELQERKLQQVAPELYNRIAAGRYLPAGAVVIGGAPRRDLLRELSEAMHEGAFTKPAEGQVDISQLLQ